MKQRIVSRSTLVLTAVVIASSTGCGTLHGNADERDAVEFIQRQGGKVEFDGAGEDQRVVKVYLHQTQINDADLAVLQNLSKLRNLFLGKTKIGDAGLEHLQNLPELQTLSLNSTHVTDAGLEPLKTLTNLKTLNLQDTHVTVAGVTRLRKALPGTTVAR